MADVLTVLLNYGRYSELLGLIKALRGQTVRPRIAVWNNGPPAEFPGAEIVIQSSSNLFCMVRWHLASRLGRQYVCILDDDMEVRDERLIERAVSTCRHYRDRRIVGRSGKNLSTGPYYYSGGRNVKADGSEKDQFADVLRGSFMFLHVRLLQQVPMYVPFYHGRGDDILVSLATATSPQFHVVAGWSHDALRAPVARPHALSGERGHYAKRDEIVSQMLSSDMVAWHPPTVRDRMFAPLLHLRTRKHLKEGRRTAGQPPA